MTTTLASFDTHHDDMIHDAQMDYYAKRLATCSSDHRIKVFDINQGVQTHVADLLGHIGPVWEVAWAHPKFGSIIASCGHDRKVIIWKEEDDSKNQWIQIYTHNDHQYSVNSISWAPHEYGLCLACASSDGYVSLITLNDETGIWTSDKFHAHDLGVNSISWAPSSTLISSIGTPTNTISSTKRRLVTGGCDNLVKIWVLIDQSNHPIGDQINRSNWILEHSLVGHKDWVRDVQWAPNIGLPSHTIASGSQDGTVYIWTLDHPSQDSSSWSKRPLEPELGETVWRVSWSFTGNILAVSSGDNRVTLWKELFDHQWKCISSPGDSTKLDPDNTNNNNS